MKQKTALVIKVLQWALFPLMFLVLPGSSQSAYAQTNTPPPPDCVKFFAFTTTGSGSQTQAVFDNRSVGCTTWTVVYQATGTGSITGLTFQSAPGASVAGTWGNYAGTVLTGSNNPLTSSTGQVAYFANTVVDTPWLRVRLVEGSFVGVLNGVYYGYRTGYQGNATSGGGGGGGGGGCMAPCVVIGPDAPGGAPTQSPVQLSGIDGSGNVQRVINTPTGLYIQGPVAGGVASTQNPVVVGMLSSTGLVRTLVTPNNVANVGESGTAAAVTLLQKLTGTTYSKDYVCNLSSPFTLSAGTDVVIIASGGGSLITKICGIYLSSDTGAAVTIRQGTGTTCGTNQVDLSGAMQNILTLALDMYPVSALQNTVAARDTCLHFSTAVTTGGFATYAQFTN